MTEPEAIPAGFQPLRIESGYAQGFGQLYRLGERCDGCLGFLVQAHHLNEQGSCHGGALAYFADMQLLAVKDQLPFTVVLAPTISFDIDYICPAILGDWVQLDTRITGVSKRMVWLQSTMSVGTKIVVQTSAKYRLLNTQGRA